MAMDQSKVHQFSMTNQFTNPESNIIMELLRSSSSGVVEYYNGFKDFFANNEPEEDLHEHIQKLERELIRMKNHLSHFKKKLAQEISINETLLEENEELKEQMFKCKICLEENISHCFSPCHHFVTCETCGYKVDNCIVCQKKIESYIRIYF